MNGMLRWLFPKQRHLALVGLGLVVWLLAWWFESHTAIEARVRDSLTAFTWVEPSDEILPVVYDDPTSDRYGPWPGDQETALALLNACERRGAVAVVYCDLPYDAATAWPRFVERVAEAGVPVLAPRLLARDRLDRSWQPVADHNLLQHDPFIRCAAMLEPDADGMFRSLPSRQRIGDGSSLAPLALATVAALDQPLPGSHRIGILCSGPAFDRSPVAAWRLIDNDLPAQMVAGRICLIGRADSLAAPGLITPSCVDGIPMPRWEVQANAIDALLQGWHPRGLPWWLEWPLVLLLCWGSARLIVGLQPLPALGLCALVGGGIILVTVVGMPLTFVGIPATRLLLAIGVITAASLGTDLLHYQREVLGILAATNKGDWLFGTDEGLPTYDRHDLQIMLQLIDRALASRGLILCAHRGRQLDVLAHSGCQPQVVRDLESGSLQAPPLTSAGSVAAEDLGMAVDDRCWCLPLRGGDDDELLAWLLCWPGDSFNTRLASELVRPLVPQLLHQVAPQTVNEADSGGPDSRFGFLSEAYLAAMTARLDRIAQRGRDERTVIRHALASIDVGMILSDGMGRCWYRNPHLATLLGRLNIEWSGKHIFTLLSQLTRQPLSQVLALIEPCYRLNEQVDIDVQLPDSGEVLRMTVTPATVEGRPQTGSPQFLPAWPNHLMVLVQERSPDAIGGGTIRRELADVVTDRASARVRALLRSLELSDNEERLAAIRKAALGLADLFHVYGGGTGAYSMTFRSRGAAKAIDLGQLVDTVVAEQTGPASDRDIALITDFGITARNILGDEQALHVCLGTVMHRALAAARDGTLLQIALREHDRDLELAIRSEENSLRSMLDDDLAEAADGVGDDSGGEYLPVRAQQLEQAIFAEAFELLEKMEGRILMQADGERGIAIIIALPKLV